MSQDLAIWLLAPRVAPMPIILYTGCMAIVLDETLQLGLAAHRDGRLLEAEQLYRAILAEYPDHAYASHYLGVLSVAIGRVHESLTLLETALRAEANEAQFWLSYIDALLRIDRLDQARDALQEARGVGLSGKSFDQLEGRVAERLNAALIGKLITAFNVKDYEELQRTATELVGRHPRSYLGWKALGLSKLRTRNPKGALEDLLNSVRLNSRDAETLRYLGEAQRNLGLLGEAEVSYSTAIATRPDYPEVYHDLGTLLAASSRHEEAEPFFRKSIALRPTMAAYTNLGITLENLGRPDEASYCFLKAISLSPRDSSAYYNFGRFLYGRGELDNAESAYRLALEHDPDSVQALVNLAETLKELGRVEDALAISDQTVDKAPTHAMAHWNRSLQNLRLGHFREGWQEYEWRWRYSDFPNREPQLSQPRWLGKESLADKRIFVCSEQGLGDTIQFCRYIRLLADNGARVLFAPQRPLTRLLKSMDAKWEVVDIDAGPISFDYYSPLMSLPLAFGTDFDSIPSSTPYLHADPERISYWPHRLEGRDFKIGICWQGNVGALDRGRSFPVTYFSRISQIPGVRLFSLHKGSGLSQLRSLPEGMNVEVFGDDFDEGTDAFVDTAAVMRMCDLVITSDTAVAHLGGALGIPTWVALKAVPDWRWMLGRSDSPWYPSIRLFRQTTRGDWHSVFDEMEGIIRTLV